MSIATQIDDLVARAYEMVPDPGRWDDLVSSFCGLIGGDSGGIFVKHRALGSFQILGSFGPDFAASLPAYLSYYERRSPLIGFYRNQAAGTVRALGQFAFSRTYRETEFFTDWVRPQGWGDMIGGHLVRQSDLYAWISVRRPDPWGPYTNSELRMAKKVAPHLSRAVQIKARIDAERGLSRSLREAFESVAAGVVLVDATARVVSANRLAELSFKANDGLRFFRGRLACERPQDTAALQTAIAACACATGAASERSPGVDLSISRGNGRRPLTVHVIPIPSPGAWITFAPSRAVAALFLVDPEAKSHRGRGIDALVIGYGLTMAENKVLREIFRCGGLVESATNLGIAETTARTHLQRIFSKTNTRNQAELVRLIMTSSLLR